MHPFSLHRLSHLPFTALGLPVPAEARRRLRMDAPFQRPAPIRPRLRGASHTIPQPHTHFVLQVRCRAALVHAASLETIRGVLVTSALHALRLAGDTSGLRSR